MNQAPGGPSQPPNHRFRLASAFVSTLPSNRLSVSDRLRLYGLFKIVTTHNGSPARPGLAFWEFERNAKAEAWRVTRAELESKALEGGYGLDVVELAQREYIERARQEGWSDENRTDDLVEDQTDEEVLLLKKEISKLLKSGAMEFSDLGLPSSQEPIPNVGLGAPGLPDDGENGDSSESDEKDEEESEDEEGCAKAGEVTRDEYGFRAAQQPHCPNDAGASTTPQDHFTMVSVSKMLPMDVDLNLDSLNLSRSPVNHRLHDLILDRDENGVKGYLDELASGDHSDGLADVIDCFHNGYTPLHLACDQGLLDVVKLLLERGADPGLKDAIDQLSACELASEAGMEHIVELLRSLRS